MGTSCQGSGVVLLHPLGWAPDRQSPHHACLANKHLPTQLSSKQAVHARAGASSPPAAPCFSCAPCVQAPLPGSRVGAPDSSSLADLRTHSSLRAPTSTALSHRDEITANLLSRARQMHDVQPYGPGFHDFP